MYGPIVEMIAKSSMGEIYDLTDDGGFLIEYRLPDRGMLNSVRSAEYLRQKK